MTRKIVDVNNPPRLSPRSEEAAMRAFEQYDTDKETIKVPQQEHLVAEFRKGMCCNHKWDAIEPTPENVKYLQQSYEETDVGARQLFCSACGATALFDDKQLWAYNATAGFFGAIPKPAPVVERPQPKQRRAGGARR
jgi:hypothetical protein